MPESNLHYAIESLPAEILTIVNGYISPVQFFINKLVCKRFNNVIDAQIKMELKQIEELERIFLTYTGDITKSHSEQLKAGEFRFEVKIEGLNKEIINKRNYLGDNLIQNVENDANNLINLYNKYYYFYKYTIGIKLAAIAIDSIKINFGRLFSYKNGPIFSYIGTDYAKGSKILDEISSVSLCSSNFRSAINKLRLNMDLDCYNDKDRSSSSIQSNVAKCHLM